MNQYYNQTKPELGQNFWMQWIMANALGSGIALGMPILLADLLSVENYLNYGITSIFSFSILVGFSQWLVIRKLIPISGWWILVSVLSPLFSLSLLIPLFSISKSLAFSIFAIYPLLLSLGQWRVLRQGLQPSWIWIITNFISVITGGFLGWILAIASQMWLGKVGTSTLIGGLGYGLIYSAIAGLLYGI